MDRGLIVGAFAFAIGFAAERAYASMAPDLARYEKMRAMSGEPPILKGLLSALVGVIGETAGKNGASGMIGDVTNDLVRYAKIRGM